MLIVMAGQVRPIAELVEVIAAENTLGEGVLWDADRQRLWWTDIQERQLLRYDPATRALERFVLPERLILRLRGRRRSDHRGVRVRICALSRGIRPDRLARPSQA